MVSQVVTTDTVPAPGGWPGLQVRTVSGLKPVNVLWRRMDASFIDPLEAGLEIYASHSYTYQVENPPLPRLAFALGPWLGGMEFDLARARGEQLFAQLLGGDPLEEVVVHCRSGVRSAQAVMMMRERGFHHARNLKGGVLAWVDEIDPSQPKY